MAEQQQSKRAGEEPKQGVGSGGDKAGEDRGSGDERAWAPEGGRTTMLHEQNTAEPVDDEQWPSSEGDTTKS